MKIAKLTIKNFRGIKNAEVFFQGHTVLVGDNNSGKSTIIEAIDLLLGPERLSRFPVIDEHDFYAGHYLSADEDQKYIKIDAIIIDLNDEQKRDFNDHLEWWNELEKDLIKDPPPNQTDEENVVPCIRISFKGNYSEDEDDFVGKTYFSSMQTENEVSENHGSPFTSKDKRKCGFLFLRTLRTGSRALSLEKGSLLDIILKLEDKRPKIWENILNDLKKQEIATNPELGISDILTNVQEAIRTFVPSEWADSPHLKVSNLTRVNLRKILTTFISTEEKIDEQQSYPVPFYRQGTGTINIIVLALLSKIADLKQNVIFAMEEPEIAIPPYTQKSIIQSVISKSAQAIFTSHSPYVMEEFDSPNILVINRESGIITTTPASYNLPKSIKPKSYKEEMKKRLCETLLARRVLITEGRTEYDAIPIAAQKLNKIDPTNFQTLESLGIAIINAEGETQIPQLGNYYRSINKVTIAIYDKQETTNSKAISDAIDYQFESPSDGFENLILDQTDPTILKKYAISLVEDSLWPPNLDDFQPIQSSSPEKIKNALRKYIKSNKGSGAAADILWLCDKEEMPKFIVDTIGQINQIIVSATEKDQK